MRTIFDRKGEEKKERRKPSWKVVSGFFIIALGCKSYKCTERKETLKHNTFICDVWDDAGGVNVMEIVIGGVVSKYTRSLWINCLLLGSLPSKDKRSCLFLWCCFTREVVSGRAAASFKGAHAVRCQCRALHDRSNQKLVQEVLVVEWRCCKTKGKRIQQTFLWGFLLDWKLILLSF